jgi:hypothetical protein
MRRSQVVALDMIFAMVVLLGATMVYVSTQFTPNTPTSTYLTYFKVASDVLSVLQKTRIMDIINNPVIQDLISQGYVTQSDYNKTVLDLLGTLWVDQRDQDSGDLTSSLLDSFLSANMNYEVLMGGDRIFIRNNTAPEYLVMNKILVSGYMVGQPIHGYMSRAWLQRARGVETLVEPISPAGSGFGDFYSRGGDFVIEKDFYVPEEAENISATLDLSVHEEGGNIDVYMNGIHQFTTYSSAIYYGSHSINNVTIGRNVLRIVLERPNTYHNHMHPGTVLKVSYTKEQNLTYVEERNKTDVLYLPYVQGSPAAWLIFPVDVPKDSVLDAASFHLQGQGVNSRIEVWVNDQMVYLNTNPPSSPNMDFNILPYLHQSSGNSTGETNIIAVYLDIRSDRDTYVSGATGTAVISNESFVSANYTLPSSRNYYGKIKHTTFIPFDELDGQGDAVTKKMYFDWEDFPIFSSYLHIVQRYSWRVAVCAWHIPESEPSWTGNDWSNYQIFKSPTGRSVPTRIFVPLEMYGYDTTNWVKMRDFDGSSSNTILPNSSVEINFLVPSQVGYGSVFANQTDAINDAIYRLNQTIAGYVESGDIDTQTTEIVDVPTMWDLAPLEVRIW